MTLFRESKFADWPFTGPRAVKEYLQAVLNGPGDLPTYHLSWVRSSGVASGSAITHEHRSLCEALRLAITKDQLDVSNLSSFESLVRRLLVLEMAVARSPSSPDFSGLDVVPSLPMDQCRPLLCPAGSQSALKREPRLQSKADYTGRSRLRNLPEVEEVVRMLMIRSAKRRGDQREEEKVAEQRAPHRPLRPTSFCVGYLSHLWVAGTFSFTGDMADVCERRRHGDVFPLPCHLLSTMASEAGLPFPQRASWIGSALNKLALQDGMNSKSMAVLPSQPPLNKPQARAANHILESLQLHGECPDGLTEEKALSMFSAGKTDYGGVPDNLASFSQEKLKILRSTMQPQHIRQFLPTEAKKVVDHYQETIIDAAAIRDQSFSPYWDPVLRTNPGKRLKFIMGLFKSGLLCLRPAPRSHVGVFFVKKKDEHIRMVLDCRATNQLHQPPPSTRLSSARCYSDLLLDSMEQTEGKTAGWAREADVNDCFYRFCLPELADFFAIDHALTSSQWRQVGIQCDSVYDHRVGREISVGDDCVLFPCFQAIPMGWSWALWLCQQAVLSIASANCPWPEGVFKEKKVTPQLSDHRTLLGVYVDNITIVGKDQDDVARRCDILDESFRTAGIPISWTQEAPVTRLESVGCVLDLQERCLMNKPHRVWRFALATQAILRRKKIRGDVLQVWTGHFTALCSLTPWGLACLQDTYRFIQTHEGRRGVIWPSVRQELKIAGALAWMCWRSLDSPIMHLVEVGDSATSGYALMASEPDPGIVRQSMLVHEKWRFLPLPLSLKESAGRGDVVAFQQSLWDILKPNDIEGNAGGEDDSFRPHGITSRYSRYVIDAMKENSWLRTSAIRSQLRVPKSRRIDIECPALVEPLHPCLCDESQYRLLWARRWKRINEPINIKEARVLLSSLRRSSRVAHLHGMRKLSLSDNLASVCCFSKGRSSNQRMNKLCRQASAIQYACKLSWSVRHVETKRNPSDRPSRLFEKRRGSVFGASQKQPRGKPAHSEPLEGVNWFSGHGESSQFCSGEGCNSQGGGGSHASSSSKPAHTHPTHEQQQMKRSRVPDEGLYPGVHGKMFLEIFSGTGRLTEAMGTSGISHVSGVDYISGAEFDVRRRSTQHVILEWIRRGIFGFIHFGTPCTIWSRARHNVVESNATRAKEELGLEMALFTAAAIRACWDAGTHFALENPRTSKLFGFHPLVCAIHRGTTYTVDFDMCRYKEEYRESTRIITSLSDLQGLQRKCNHDSHKVWLQGKVKVFNRDGLPIYVNRTSLAGAYPYSFCALYASILSRSLNLHCDAAASVNTMWIAALRSAAQRKPATQFATVKPRQEQKADSDTECSLLQQHGGLEQFIDCIALGRRIKKPWKKEKSQRAQRTGQSSHRV
eukprot:Skav225301  [mRNA]  locus=scaffold445:112717:116856:+ [translate_table: standard]